MSMIFLIIFLAPTISFAAGYHWNASQGPDQGKTPAEACRSYEYDENGRLTDWTASFDGAIAQMRALEYDAFNNISGHSVSDDMVNFDELERFDYDPQQRLERVIANYGQIDYGYDPVGNRTSRQWQVGDPLQEKFTESYHYLPGSNQLETVEQTLGGASLKARNLTYDARGTITEDQRVYPTKNVTVELTPGPDNRLQSIDSTIIP